MPRYGREFDITPRAIRASTAHDNEMDATEGFVEALPEPAAPVAAYGYGCNACGGWVRERLPDPEQQYYYVNQGPTYTGPGAFAPHPQRRPA